MVALPLFFKHHHVQLLNSRKGAFCINLIIPEIKHLAHFHIIIVSNQYLFIRPIIFRVDGLKVGVLIIIVFHCNELIQLQLQGLCGVFFFLILYCSLCILRSLHGVTGLTGSESGVSFLLKSENLDECQDEEQRLILLMAFFIVLTLWTCLIVIVFYLYIIVTFSIESIPNRY